MITVLWQVAPFFFALALAPVCRRMAWRLSLVDRPRADRFHGEVTPKLGGLVILAALAPSLVYFLSRDPMTLPLVAGVVIAFLTGLVDDIRPLPPRAKLLGQLLAAGLSARGLLGVMAAEVAAGWLGGFPTWLLWGLGTVGMVGFQNAVNMLDNMDGISTGVVGIALVALALQISGGRELALCVAAACFGFLPWNTTRPARLFLGDAGSLPLGHALGFFCFATALGATAVSQAAAIVVAVLVPLIDIAFVTITRLQRGQSPAVGGRDHTTHRLAERLGSVVTARRLFWVVGIAVGALSLWIRTLPTTGAMAAVGLLLGAAVGLGRRIAGYPEPAPDRN